MPGRTKNIIEWNKKKKIQRENIHWGINRIGHARKYNIRGLKVKLESKSYQSALQSKLKYMIITEHLF